jgi:hypothetical protein
VVWGEHRAKWAPNFPLPQEPAIPIEDLDAGILPVANIDQVAINHDRVGSVELPRPSALHSQPSSLLPYLSNFSTREFP